MHGDDLLLALDVLWLWCKDRCGIRDSFPDYWRTSSLHSYYYRDQLEDIYRIREEDAAAFRLIYERRLRPIHKLLDLGVGLSYSSFRVDYFFEEDILDHLGSAAALRHFFEEIAGGHLTRSHFVMSDEEDE